MTMKVGVLQFFSWPGRHGPLEDVYARALERIEIMDRGGFDAVWLAEHHFTTFSVCPSVHMLGTLAAARTKRLRIGTAVSLAALYHPLRLAEEVALLDMLSGGRVNWGAGRGFAHSEFNAFGVPPEESAERFREAVEIVLQAWTQERFSFQGTHFNFDDIEVLPKPLQQPHPPIWMAATSEYGDRLGGEPRLFHPDGSARLDDGSGRQASALCAEARRGGLLGRGPRYPDGAAARAGADHGRGRGHRPARRAVAGRRLCRSAARPSQVDAASTYDGKDPTQYYVDSVILHGTPESVVEQIGRLKEEIGLNYLMCAPLSRETFHLLADQVLPRL